MTFYKWSETANNNQTADSTINWAEGQAPSTVNDSARAMMAAAKKFYNDISGNGVTTGTLSAFVYATHQVFSSLAFLDNALIAVKFHLTNGASPTINIDGLGAKALVSTASTPIVAGSLVIGRIYMLVYKAADDQVYVIGLDGGELTAPSGTRMPFQQNTAPTGWTKDATAGLDNSAFRMVTTTTATSGGTVLFSTLYARTTTDAVTLVQANLPSVNFNVSAASVSGATHNHSLTSPIQDGGANYSATGGGVIPTRSVSQSLPSSSTGSTDPGGSVSGQTAASGGSSTSFSPAIDMRVRFVDMIVASKD